MESGMNIWLFLISVASSVLAAEIFGWLPWLSARLVQLQARRLPAEMVDATEEQWLADLRSQPTGLSQLFFAVDLFRAVYRINSDLRADGRGLVPSDRVRGIRS